MSKTVPRSFPTENPHQWQNNYVVIAENRPLQTLLEMKNISDHEIEFTETDYELQYKLYYEVEITVGGIRTLRLKFVGTEEISC